MTTSETKCSRALKQSNIIKCYDCSTNVFEVWICPACVMYCHNGHKVSSIFREKSHYNDWNKHPEFYCGCFHRNPDKKNLMTTSQTPMKDHANEDEEY